MLQMLVEQCWSCSRYGDNKVFLRFFVSLKGFVGSTEEERAALKSV
jgi:hypothetical protein